MILQQPTKTLTKPETPMLALASLASLACLASAVPTVVWPSATGGAPDLAIP